MNEIPVAILSIVLAIYVSMFVYIEYTSEVSLVFSMVGLFYIGLFLLTTWLLIDVILYYADIK